MERQDADQPRTDSRMISKDQRINSEGIARLSTYPILPLLIYLQTHAVSNTFSRLFPSHRLSILPYIPISSSLLAIPGFIIVIGSLKNPKNEISNDFIKRTFLASMDGLGFILPFLMGDLIKVYCSEKKDPTICEVSDVEFWTTFFPGPAIATVLYSVWNGISLDKKRAWLSQGAEKKTLVFGIDALSNMLLYSQVIRQLMFMIHPRPGAILYEIVSLPASIIALIVGSFQQRHREKMNAIIRYFMLASLMFYMGSFLKTGFEQQTSSWSLMLTALSLPALCIATTICSLYYGGQFLRGRGHEPSWTRSGRFSLPLEQEIAASLQDPAQMNRIIAAFLADPHATQALCERLNIDPVSNRDSSPRSIEEAMQNPVYREIIKMTMAEIGYTVTEAPDEPDELQILDSNAHGLQRTPSVLSQSQSQGEKALLLSRPFGNRTPYYTTDDIACSSTDRQQEPQPKRRLSVGAGGLK